MKHYMLSLLLLCCVPGLAQRQNVSGVVKGPDGGIEKVSIREIDANHRVFNHTTTDKLRELNPEVKKFKAGVKVRVR